MPPVNSLPLYQYVAVRIVVPSLHSENIFKVIVSDTFKLCCLSLSVIHCCLAANKNLKIYISVVERT